jgi:Zn-dependent protease with chaperone function
MPQASFMLAALLALQSSGSFSEAASFPVIAKALASQSARDAAVDAVNRTRMLIDKVIASSYPELEGSDIRVKVFRSRSDYFKARFGYPQYFFTRMRYLVFVNLRVFEMQAPEAGVRAIIAHELAHLVYFKSRNRVQLVGLVRLTSKRFTARFERWADLKAISLGYGEGLKGYRQWLYTNVPASKLDDKHRNYFSPDEIDAILSKARTRPELFEYWLKHVPLNMDQILATK